ncbi:hypothetical protein [Synechococcus sp. M16CYN]
MIDNQESLKVPSTVCFGCLHQQQNAAAERLTLADQAHFAIETD